MGFATWLRTRFSYRRKAISRYRRGMATANRRDHNGAITDYSSVIESPHAPDDVKAMATYNRALAYSSVREDERAADDLATVLAMPGLPVNVKNHAQQRRERIRRRD